MPSCSRIAIRRGDVDASRSGGAGGASATFARHPDLFRRPLLAPLCADVAVAVVRLRVLRCEELDETHELETVRAQYVDPVTVAHVEFDFVRVGPVDPLQTALRSLEV